MGLHVMGSFHFYRRTVTSAEASDTCHRLFQVDLATGILE